MTDFGLKRLGTVMEPQPDDVNEAEGVLNPAAIRGPDGQLYLFPRLVAPGNYSRIGIARVLFDSAGDPTGVERLGVALEPEADYETGGHGGGCEDPRISFVEPLQQYVMTYTAFSRRGPRIAFAVSDDLLRWRRLGLATFRTRRGLPFDVDNKDASFFPALIPNPFGRPALALVHRPLLSVTGPAGRLRRSTPRAADVDEQSIWISYCRIGRKKQTQSLGNFVAHRRLGRAMAPWEQLKIGGGTPPVPCRHGWLMVYHGAHEFFDGGKVAEALPPGSKKRYAAGVMVLSLEHPNRIAYRSPEPVLVPEGPHERYGTVDNVVFPTGIDRRDDLGKPDRFDIYYGMADNRIGVARLELPATLPAPAAGAATSLSVQPRKRDTARTLGLPAARPAAPDEAAVMADTPAE